MTGEFGWKISLASSVRLLRVLEMEVQEFPPNDEEIMQLLNLRLPEIWDLPQLRHLLINRVVLPDPPCYHNDEQDFHILVDLWTLFRVLNFRCTEEVLKRVPNLKKLDVSYDHLSPGVHWPYFCLHHLVHLHKLESLTFVSLDRISSEYLCFPVSLKELYLYGCRLRWENMTIVGSLPNLEVLSLWSYAFEGLMWCSIEGEFVRLKVLEIRRTDLLHWRGDKTHFPILEHLRLAHLPLEEIPLELGELQTIRKIELDKCTDSAITSAKQILEEQESFGNEVLEVMVNGKRIYQNYEPCLLRGIGIGTSSRNM